MTDGPWHHDMAFHRELIRAVPGRDARVLDIGCGNGLLVGRLAAPAGEVVGIDSDEASAAAARERVAAIPNARIVGGDALDDAEPAQGGVDLVTSVAALHRLPLRPALRRMRDLLAPGGRLRVVGLAVSGDLLDHALALAQVVPVRLIGGIRHEASDPRMVIAAAGVRGDHPPCRGVRPAREQGATAALLPPLAGVDHAVTGAHLSGVLPGLSGRPAYHGPTEPTA